MILVAVAVVLAAAVGVGCERRLDTAARISAQTLRLMLYVLVPFVSYVNIAHLHVTVGAGVGIAFGWVMILTVGLLAFALGRFALHLPDRQLGALITTVVVVNTGYLGLPMAVVLLHARALATAVAYDQLISSPALPLLGFGVGAAFGVSGSGGQRERLRAFVLRNPPLLGVIAGLLAPPSLAPAPLPAISHVVVGALLVLGFFAVGVNLSAERRAEGVALLGRPDRRVAVAVGLRLLAAPLILAALATPFVRLPTAYLLQAGMPSGVNTLIVGHAYDLDLRLIASIVVWSTLVVLVAGLVLSLLL